ncbi:MAG TPA: hypothetical protein VFW98_18625 [Gemmatimonadaceae bacterium]|nr:hypothetical protein [Gemmatimonadaceae bacterium]
MADSEGSSQSRSAGKDVEESAADSGYARPTSHSAPPPPSALALRSEADLRGFIRYYAQEELDKLLESEIAHMVKGEVDKRIGEELELYQARVLRKVRAEIAAIPEPTSHAIAVPLAPQVKPTNLGKESHDSRILRLLGNGCFGLGCCILTGAVSAAVRDHPPVLLLAYLVLVALVSGVVGLLFHHVRD